MNASPAARFGFLVHPLTPLQRRLLGVRAADVGLIAGRSAVWHGPVEIAHLRTTTAPAGHVEGWLMALPSLPEALIEQQEDAVRDLAVAVRACADRGAQVVGLGALTALIGAHGRALEQIAAVPVTSGTALTSWAAVETLRLAQMQGLRASRTPVALLGLPGPAAMGITRLLVAQGHAVEVVVPAPPRALERQLDALNALGPGSVGVTPCPYAALQSGRLLVAASTTGGRLSYARLPRGAIVVDVAEPVDVLYDAPQRDDVLVLDGELVDLPGRLTGSQPWTWVYERVTGQRGALFACFVEPMVVAASNDATLAGVGRDVPLERIVALGNAARSLGFGVRTLYERGRTVRAARVADFSTARPKSAGR